MQWSGLSWRFAVVGYNAHGDVFDNHPVSGLEPIGTAVACPNNVHFRVPWNNLVYHISPPPDHKRTQIMMCLNLYHKDVMKWGTENDMQEISQKLEPCPCFVQQAWIDWGRFRYDWSSGICFLQLFPLPENNGVFTQKCCYGYSE